MTSQHSGGQTTVHTVSSVCVTTSRIDAFLIPTPHWCNWVGMECLWDFLPSFLPGFAKSLQRDGLVWSSQPSVHFVPHMLDWWQIGGHRGPSHHQHILMSEKIHDETRNVWSRIVLLEGHLPSLTTDEGQHVRSNNLLQVAVCIQIAINNDQGCPAMGWDATPTITLPPPNARLCRMHASW